MSLRKVLNIPSGSFIVFFVLLVASVYFRTYQLHGGLNFVFYPPNVIAHDMVNRVMKEQVSSTLAKRFPNLSSQDLDKLATERVEQLQAEDHDQYEETVRQTISKIEEVRLEKKLSPYLLEADPYHYLYQTEMLLKEGSTGESRKSGKVFQPLMRAPHGHWEPFLLHPYVGAASYLVAHAIGLKASLIQVTAYTPLFLTILVLIIFLGLLKVLQADTVTTWIAAATLLLSPIFIQRSALGWYDTDPYNYIFPLSILIFVFWGIKNPKRIFWGALGASCLTATYSFFWTGWPFMFILAPIGILIASMFLGAREDAEGRLFGRRGLGFVIFYILITITFLIVFMTPNGMSESIKMNWSVLNKFFLGKAEIWPNIFLTVGEARGITLKKLIFLTGNYVTFGLFLAGIVLEGWDVFRKRKPFFIFRYLFFACFALPLLLMSLKTERFSLLFVMPLAFFAGLGSSKVLTICKQLVDSRMKNVSIPGRALGNFLITGVVFCVFLSPLLLSAHVVAGEIHPIMDKVWNDALLTIKEKTPDNAIINAWWPPGYFITAVANRRVTLDGGTQNFPETFWMARAFFADDEREAAGIFRMLNLSGNDALDFLQELGWSVPDAVALILKIVPLGRREAFQILPDSVSNAMKQKLLDLTHGKGEPPVSYTLVYNDFVEKNLAVTIMARWDFRKAEKLEKFKTNNGFQDFLGLLGGNAAKRYIQDLRQISGDILRYTPVSVLAQRSNEQLFFKNGLRVDLNRKDAFVFIPSEKVAGKPASLFFVEDGRLVERITEGDHLEVSALFFIEEGKFYSVIADARLIRSILFRLYYLNGCGLSLFKPFLTEGSMTAGTFIRVFQLDFEKFSNP